MTSDHQNPSVNPADDPAVHTFSEEEASFDPKRFILVAWSYRKVVLTAVVLALPFYLVVTLAAYLLQPIDRFATLQFRARFDGAADGVYPNGLAFSEQDIASDPVLTAVFERNDLQRYGALAVFKGGLFVTQSSPERETLDFEYRSKLADTKLSPVDRQRLEEEYRRKRDSLTRIGYALNYHRQDSFPVPPTLAAKVLLDILSEWAAQAVDRRGVLKYDIHMPSAAIQPSTLNTAEDAWLAVQALARKATLVMKASDRIMKLPGASLQRIGEFKISVTDLRTALDDLRRSRIVPLSRELAGAPGVERLLREQLQTAIISQNGARGRIKSLQSALSAYDLKTGPMAGGPQGVGGGQNGAQNNGVMAPQLSDTFLDKLVELSNRASSQGYRQNLTDRFIEEGAILEELEADTEFFQGMLTGQRGTSLSVEARDARVRQIEQELSAAIKGLQEVYEDVSVKNLNPGTALYSVSGPVFTSAERSFGVRRAVLYGALVELVVLLVVLVACGFHAGLSGKFNPAPIAA